jgi:LmbE family N-acetylglucosaminyl deacetylase
MRGLSPWIGDGPLELLLLGAHPDDIEIGCGGSVLHWVREGRIARVTWVVLSGTDEREREARTAAARFLAGVPIVDVRVERFRDGFFPYVGERLKESFEALKSSSSPDIILTHDRDDRHQDHRLVGELTWQTFRDHLILEYEVPKFDGELGRPNAYVEVPGWAAEEKARLIVESFPSQIDRHWFTSDTFIGLARLRGVECRSSSGHAEGFRCRKTVLV